MINLGTPQQISDATQTIVWKADYNPFGEATMTTETIVNNLRFPGQYYDEETGLHYNYKRYYEPFIGRYITSDPIGLNGGINTYGYVGANPFTFYDPLGLDRSIFNGDIGVGGGFSAFIGVIGGGFNVYTTEVCREGRLYAESRLSISIDLGFGGSFKASGGGTGNLMLFESDGFHKPNADTGTLFHWLWHWTAFFR